MNIYLEIYMERQALVRDSPLGPASK